MRRVENTTGGLVLDMRGNPGGLLTSRDRCGILPVPKGSDTVAGVEAFQEFCTACTRSDIGPETKLPS
jgi:hypothetical protein